MTDLTEENGLAMDLHRKMLARAPRNAGRRWFDIRNADTGKAIVRIYDEIGYFGVTAEQFAREIEAITAPEIEVQISSPGGSVFEAIAIYNSLRSHPARVTTRVDGIAASAASLIVQAGDHRVMLGSSQMMIHDAWAMFIGSASEMREFADFLDKQCDVLARIYATRSGRPVEECRAIMAAETWLTDAEAVEAAMADEVVEPARTEAPAAVAAAVDRAHALVSADVSELAVVAAVPPISGDEPEAPSPDTDPEEQAPPAAEQAPDAAEPDAEVDEDETAVRAWAPQLAALDALSAISQE